MSKDAPLYFYVFDENALCALLLSQRDRAEVLSSKLSLISHLHGGRMPMRSPSKNPPINNPVLGDDSGQYFPTSLFFHSIVIVSEPKCSLMYCSMSLSRFSSASEVGLISILLIEVKLSL